MSMKKEFAQRYKTDLERAVGTLKEISTHKPETWAGARAAETLATIAGEG